MSNNIFNRQGRVIFGVCSHLATKTNVSPFVFRLVFIVATLCPIVAFLFSIDHFFYSSEKVFLFYFILSLLVNIAVNKRVNRIMKRRMFAIIGAILGIPLSYYFQSEMLKGWIGGIGNYLQHFGQIVANSDFIGNVIVSVIVFASVGGIIGYFIDENETKKEQ